MNEMIVETHDLTKTYNAVTALHRVNIRVKRGNIYGLIGDNGAGKSTLLKLIAGQAFASSGEIRLFGAFREKQLRDVRCRTGALIEQPGFFPNMTVEHMMEYYRIQKGIPGKEKPEEILRLTGIWDRRKTRCGVLSMGMKQRLGLAIAMIGEPELLLLDEPINGLDPSGIIELRNLFHRLNEEKGITIVLSSHILSELQQTASVFAFLDRGRLLQEISAEKLLAACSNYIELGVSDPEAFTVLLERYYPDKHYQVIADQTLRIMDSQNTPEVYGRLASDHNICISKLVERRTSLEDYYMSLKNGGAKAC